mgnify:CR=1 FL=1
MSNFFTHKSSYVSDLAKIGDGTKIWHFSHIMEDVEIGKNCVIGQNVFIARGVKIGNNCKIQNNVSIYEGLILEDDVFCGPSCVFTNVVNPRSFVIRRDEFKQTILRKGSSIGANSTIICGNEIGKYSLVGAGALVTKDVKAFSVVYGIPASFKGWVSKNGNILDEQLICPETGEKYRLDNDNLILNED